MMQAKGKTGKIRLTGYIDVPGDRLEAVRAALAEHIRLTRAEPGCEVFEVTPSPRDPARLQVYEVFASRAAFDAHQARASASDWARLTAGIERHYRIEELPA